LGAHIIACSKTSARIIEGKDTPEISRKVWKTNTNAKLHKQGV